jgi:parvulin-like peptidyl-prolyl isomerase
MKIVLLYLLIIFQFHLAYGQRSLFNQKYFNLAEDFNLTQETLDAYKSQGRLEVFNEVKQKTSLTKKIINSKVGKSIKFDKGYYKGKYEIVAKSHVPHYRVRYIFINKNKFEEPQQFEAYLNKIRGLIQKTEFKSIAMQYSMDYKKGVGGDSGWFKKGKTNPEFFKEVTKASLLAEEVFEFEITEENWYYVVKKTHSKMDIEEALVVEIREE